MINGHVSTRGFMDREELDIWLGRGILGLLLAVLIVAPLAMGAVLQSQFVMVQLLTVLILIAWGARIWIKPKPRLLWVPTCWVVIAFTLYAGIAYWLADIEYIARMEWIKVLVYAFLFFVIVNNFFRQESIQAISYVLVTMALVLAVYAGLQFLTGSNQVWGMPRPEQYAGRGSGTYICPNHLAGFLEMVLPIGLAFVLGGRLGHVWRIVLVYACGVILAGIAVTVSRGGWIATGLALGVLLVFLLSRPGYRIPAAAALIVLIAGGVWFLGNTRLSQERFDQIVVSGRVDNPRFDLWQSAWEMWRDHPWLGVGPAHFNERFPQYRPESIQAMPDRAHNDYLNTLADFGVLGLGGVLLALGLVAWGFFRSWRQVRRSSDDFGAKRSNRSAFVLGAGIGMLAILLHSWVDFNMHIPANAIVAVTLIGLLSTHWRHISDRYWVRLRLLGKIAATLVLLAGILYLGIESVRRLREQAAFKRAAMAKPGSEKGIKALRDAFEMEPNNAETAYSLGERFRAKSWQGDFDYEKWARKAIQWFERATAINPYHYRAEVRLGMCWDWLGDHEKADSHFDRALELDPNGYFTMAYVGWHYVQMERYAKAKPYLERSRSLKPRDNPVAKTYLRRVRNHLAEKQ